MTRRRLLALVAVAAVALQFPGNLPLSAGALTLWLGALALGSRETLAKIWRPRWWAATLVVALLAGWLLGEHDLELAGVPLSSTGLTAGALMVIRAALLLSLAAWASAQVDEAGLRRAFARIGLPSLGGALGAALRLLPEMQARWGAARAAARASGSGRLAGLRAVLDTVVWETVVVAEESARDGEAAAPPNRQESD